MNPISWIPADKRKYLYVGIALVGTHAFSFALGRYTVPETIRIEEKVRIEKVEVEKQVVVIQEKVRVERVVVKDERKSIRREEYAVEHPNGLKESRKTEDINIDRVVREAEVQYVDRVVEKEVVKFVEHTEVKEKLKLVEAPKPDWRVGALVGVQVTSPTSPIYGGIVERRILGPVSAGAWGLSNGTVGVTATLEF